MTKKKVKKKEIKTYSVPQEVKGLFLEGASMLNLRDVYIGKRFGFKKAKRCTIESATAINKAWGMVYDLYPKLKKHTLNYNHETFKVTIVK